MSAKTEIITFQSAKRVRAIQRKARESRRQQQLAKRKPATVAKRLALAHRIDREIRAGLYEDYADVARHNGLTRARLTQLMNLLLLAPCIQEEILSLEFPAGREPVTERTLRRVLVTMHWAEQRALWVDLRLHVD